MGLQWLQWEWMGTHLSPWTWGEDGRQAPSLEAWSSLKHRLFFAKGLALCQERRTGVLTWGKGYDQVY